MLNINEIAKQAHNLVPRDCNKASCYQVVRDLIAGEEMTVEQAAMLYAYFAPAIPAKPKTPEQWVAKAMAKKDVRYYLQYIYSDGARIMATDGHRVHIWHTDQYPAGFYDANMVQIEVDGTFPDINRVIPKNPDLSLPVAELSIEHLFDSDSKPVDGYKFDGVAINGAYMDQALSCQDFDQIQYSDGGSSVLMASADKQAVIMPISCR